MAITTGYANMWPREIFDERAELEGRRGKKGKQVLAGTLDFLTKNPGVYVLYRNETPHYIGKAECLYNRLWKHANTPRDKYYHFWTHFSAFAVKDSMLRGELEGILIATMPTANSAEPKLQKEALPPEVARLMQRLRRGRLSQP
jgi:hypothetical protein